MTVDVQLTGDRDLDQELARHMNGAANVLGIGAVNALMGPDSQWPIDTGLSIASFGYELVGSDGIQIVNEADYSIYVEQGIPAERTKHSALNTINAAMPALIEELDEWLSGRLDG